MQTSRLSGWGTDWRRCRLGRGERRRPNERTFKRAVDIIRTTRYQHRDEVSLILEAREYIKGRLPVRDRATAVAILLQRDAVLIESPERGQHESGTV
jgi:hypothetical protein